MQLGTGMRLTVPDVDELHKAAVQDTLKGRGAEPVAIPEKRVETFDFWLLRLVGTSRRT